MDSRISADEDGFLHVAGPVPLGVAEIVTPPPPTPPASPELFVPITPEPCVDDYCFEIMSEDESTFSEAASSKDPQPVPDVVLRHPPSVEDQREEQEHQWNKFGARVGAHSLRVRAREDRVFSICGAKSIASNPPLGHAIKDVCAGIAEDAKKAKAPKPGSSAEPVSLPPSEESDDEPITVTVDVSDLTYGCSFDSYSIHVPIENSVPMDGFEHRRHLAERHVMDCLTQMLRQQEDKRPYCIKNVVPSGVHFSEDLIKPFCSAVLRPPTECVRVSYGEFCSLCLQKVCFPLALARRVMYEPNTVCEGECSPDCPLWFVPDNFIRPNLAKKAAHLFKNAWLRLSHFDTVVENIDLPEEITSVPIVKLVSADYRYPYQDTPMSPVGVEIQSWVRHHCLEKSTINSVLEVFIKGDNPSEVGALYTDVIAEAFRAGIISELYVLSNMALDKELSIHGWGANRIGIRCSIAELYWNYCLLCNAVDNIPYGVEDWMKRYLSNGAVVPLDIRHEPPDAVPGRMCETCGCNTLTRKYVGVGNPPVCKFCLASTLAGPSWAQKFYTTVGPITISTRSMPRFLNDIRKGFVGFYRWVRNNPIPSVAVLSGVMALTTYVVYLRNKKREEEALPPRPDDPLSILSDLAKVILSVCLLRDAVSLVTDHSPESMRTYQSVGHNLNMVTGLVSKGGVKRTVSDAFIAAYMPEGGDQITNIGNVAFNVTNDEVTSVTASVTQNGTTNHVVLRPGNINEFAWANLLATRDDTPVHESELGEADSVWRRFRNIKLSNIILATLVCALVAWATASFVQWYWSRQRLKKFVEKRHRFESEHLPFHDSKGPKDEESSPPEPEPSAPKKEEGKGKNKSGRGAQKQHLKAYEHKRKVSKHVGQAYERFAVAVEESERRREDLFQRFMDERKNLRNFAGSSGWMKDNIRNYTRAITDELSSNIREFERGMRQLDGNDHEDWVHTAGKHVAKTIVRQQEEIVKVAQTLGEGTFQIDLHYPENSSGPFASHAAVNAAESFFPYLPVITESQRQLFQEVQTFGTAVTGMMESIRRVNGHLSSYGLAVANPDIAAMSVNDEVFSRAVPIAEFKRMLDMATRPGARGRWNVSSSGAYWEADEESTSNHKCGPPCKQHFRMGPVQLRIYPNVVEQIIIKWNAQFAKPEPEDKAPPKKGVLELKPATYAQAATSAAATVPLTKVAEARPSKGPTKCGLCFGKPQSDKDDTTEVEYTPPNVKGKKKILPVVHLVKSGVWICKEVCKKCITGPVDLPGWEKRFDPKSGAVHYVRGVGRARQVRCERSQESVQPGSFTINPDQFNSTWFVIRGDSLVVAPRGSSSKNYDSDCHVVVAFLVGNLLRIPTHSLSHFADDAWIHLFNPVKSTGLKASDCSLFKFRKADVVTLPPELGFPDTALVPIHRVVSAVDASTSMATWRNSPVLAQYVRPVKPVDWAIDGKSCMRAYAGYLPGRVFEDNGLVNAGVSLTFNNSINDDKHRHNCTTEKGSCGGMVFQCGRDSTAFYIGYHRYSDSEFVPETKGVTAKIEAAYLKAQRERQAGASRKNTA